MSKASDLLSSMQITDPLHQQIITEIIENGPITRPELVKRLDFPRTTIYDNIKRIHRATGIITKFSKPNNKRGRPFVYYKISL